MNSPQDNANPASNNRRDFLKTSGAALAGGALAGSLTIGRSAHAAGGDVLKIGLIGCGGRGSGAANEALTADKNTRLVAMGDAFADRLRGSRNSLSKKWGPRADVPEERSFVGFDAYEKVLACDVDVVLLATPPHFRPAHFRAAIEAGKHVFCEKPVAVDAPGVRSVLETAELARKKHLWVVSGLCWRYDVGAKETMKRILDGQIGDLVAIQENYLAGPLWSHKRRENWSDMEYQMRNWLYYTWLSGDHNVEQHIHSLDKAAWAMHDTMPDAMQATGVGGRQVRTEPIYGHIFDHHCVYYEWPSGVRVFAYTRQQAGCRSDTEDYMFGANGQASVIRHEIRDRKGNVAWRYDKRKPRMHQVEQNEFFAGLRSGQYINNGDYMAKSTLMAIQGRMATYTGKSITWKKAMESQQRLGPEKYEWGEMPVPPVALPGLTEFS